MKQILATKVIKIPKEVTVTVKARRVTVVGPRGTLSKDFRHVKLDLQLINGGRGLRAELWFGDRKSLACIRTITSHIANMITGVTKGFETKMRMVYAHFPISVSIEGDGKRIEMRNFLGEKIVRVTTLGDGVTAVRSADVKDQIVLTGNDINAVNQSAANIHGRCLARNKDIRKFLDGIYVSEAGLAQ